MRSSSARRALLLPWNVLFTASNSGGSREMCRLIPTLALTRRRPPTHWQVRISDSEWDHPLHDAHIANKPLVWTWPKHRITTTIWLTGDITGINIYLTGAFLSRISLFHFISRLQHHQHMSTYLKHTNITPLNSVPLPRLPSESRSLPFHLKHILTMRPAINKPYSSR